MMLQPPPTHYHTCHRLPSVPDPVFWPLRVAVGSHSPAATPNCRSLAPPRLQAANDAIDHAHLTPSHCRIALVSLRHNHQYATAASIASPSLLCQRRRLPRLQSEQQQHRSTTTQQKRHLWSHSSDAKQQQRATTNGSLCRSIACLIKRHTRHKTTTAAAAWLGRTVLLDNGGMGQTYDNQPK